MRELWQPTASLEAVQQRAQLYAVIRDFMAERHVLEVQTPIFSHKAVTDPNLHSFSTTLTSPQDTDSQCLYLNTSPEFAMKRLLASGSGCIYQITHAFRDEEISRLHEPEFTLLEWYRTGFNDIDLINEINDLLKKINIDSGKCIRYSDAFFDIFAEYPDELRDDELLDLTAQYGLRAEILSRNDMLDFLFSEKVVPALGEAPMFITDFPVSQAALAKIEGGVAKRFELIIKGIEIANGFYELNDAQEQGKRFDNDNKQRKINKMNQVPRDEYLLQALPNMPDCAGVAIGLDRLLMVMYGYNDIKQVISFPTERS